MGQVTHERHRGIIEPPNVRVQPRYCVALRNVGCKPLLCRFL